MFLSSTWGYCIPKAGRRIPVRGSVASVKAGKSCSGDPDVSLFFEDHYSILGGGGVREQLFLCYFYKSYRRMKLFVLGKTKKSDIFLLDNFVYKETFQQTFT